MGHGHVTPNPDGAVARCGGPGMCPECQRELAQAARPAERPVQTGELINLGYFAYGHLPPHLQLISQPLSDLAVEMSWRLEGASELEAGLRKLLEAKDCFVRAALSKGKERSTNG